MIFQNCPKYHEPRSGQWYLGNFETLRAGIVAKYYVQVMLLFVYNRSREIPDNAREFVFYGCKNEHRRLRSQQSFYINGRVCETRKKTFKANNIKQYNEVIDKSRLLLSLQR